VLATYGKNASFIVPSNAQSSYDPTTGIATPSVTTYTVKIAPPELYDAQYANGDTIRIGDAKTIIAASGLPFTPVLGIGLTIDATNWTIVDVQALYSGELIAAYELRIRR